MELVDQPGLDRLGGEVGTPTPMSLVRGRLQLLRTASMSKSRSMRVLALDTSASVLEYDDLLGRLPDLRVVPDERGWSAAVSAVSQYAITS